MKIGEFSNKIGVNRDTIRYYTKFGLILPEKKENYYLFDERCYADMREVLELKRCNFSLSEIHKILSFRRISNLLNQQDINFYLSFFHNKKHSLQKEKNDIEKKIAFIDEKMKEICQVKSPKTKKIGVPIEFIVHMCCPICDGELNLKDANISGTQIFSGKLNCQCGYHAKIEDGIIITADINIGEKQIYPVTGEVFTKNLAPSLISLIQRGINCMEDKIFENEKKKIIILDIATNIGLFIKNIIQKKHKKIIYIATHESIKVLKLFKKNIEQLEKNLICVFIVAKKNLPIKKQTVDMIVDFYGTSFNVLTASTTSSLFSINGINRYLKWGGNWVGAYLCYNKAAKTLFRLNSEQRDFLNMDNLKKLFTRNKFKKLDSKNIGFIDEPGKIFSLHNEKDKVSVWFYYGIKNDLL